MEGGVAGWGGEVDAQEFEVSISYRLPEAIMRGFGCGGLQRSKRIHGAVPNSIGVARHKRGSLIAPRHSGSNPSEFLCEADTSADCALELLQRWRSHILTASLAPDLASLEIDRIVNFADGIVS
jgi:hypothetical protein